MGGAPAWHPDPHDPASGILRWWDGQRWTEHLTGAPPVPPVPATPGVIEPLAGPRALDDETVDRMLEGLVADYRRRWHLARGDEVAFTGFEPELYEDHVEAYVVELQRRLPAGEPPLDLRHVETARDLFVCPMIVVTARRVVVISCSHIEACERPDVAEAALEQVHIARKVARTPTVTFAGGQGLTLAVDRERRQWLEGFRSGPRVVQGRMEELLGRPGP